MILDKAIAINDMLKGKKSKIAFIIHDSIVLDYADEDGDFINAIYWEFMSTPFGMFKTNVCGGRNFGEMYNLWM